jgi:hypothetical protein
LVTFANFSSCKVQQIFQKLHTRSRDTTNSIQTIHIAFFQKGQALEQEPDWVGYSGLELELKPELELELELELKPELELELFQSEK